MGLDTKREIRTLVSLIISASATKRAGPNRYKQWFSPTNVIEEAIKLSLLYCYALGSKRSSSRTEINLAKRPNGGPKREVLLFL